jgi:hypothetical protein
VSCEVLSGEEIGLSLGSSPALSSQAPVKFPGKRCSLDFRSQSLSFWISKSFAGASQSNGRSEIWPHPDIRDQRIAKFAYGYSFRDDIIMQLLSTLTTVLSKLYCYRTSGSTSPDQVVISVSYPSKHHVHIIVSACSPSRASELVFSPGITRYRDYGFEKMLEDQTFWLPGGKSLCAL